MRKPWRILMLLLCSVLLTPFGSVQAQETDRVTGLVMTPGWQQVQANCTRCHSAQIITQNSGTREVWKSRIVWMQETQGLSQLGPAVESGILDYLAANYGPKAASRRAALPASQLPAR